MQETGQKTGIRLDPWPAEYESSFQIDEFDQDSAGKRNLTVGNAELDFEPLPVPENTPAAAVEGLQYFMRNAEARLAEELAVESACVFADGPLHYFTDIKQPVVGVIKRLIEPYLS